MFCGAVAATVGCSDADSADPATADPGRSLMAEAYSALKAADYDQAPALISRLDAAFDADQKRGRLAFYGGTMRLWLATGGERAPGDVLNDVLGAIDKLELAHELGPTDPHAAAFLGIAQVALGTALREEARIETGRGVLDDGVRLYPPYVNGVRTQAFGMLPRDHALFPRAIDSMYETFEGCGLEAAPGSELNVVYPSTADKPLSTCWNGGIVAHVWEGIFLIYGDVLVKSGDVALGRRLYEAAKASPTYDRWLFNEQLEARIAGAEARAALYLDDDQSNDPPTWMQERNLCVGCHASKP